MSVVLDDDVGMLFFDGSYHRTQHGRTSDTGHVLKTDFVSTIFNKYFCQVDIIFGRVNSRVGHTHGGLRGHAGLLGPFDRRNDVARVVQSTENTRDIHPLGMFYLIHQLTHIGRHRIHAQRIQTTVQHVGLYIGIVESLGKGTYSLVGVFSVQQIHLFGSTAIGFHAVETTHVHNNGSDGSKLIFAGYIFARRLPHISVNQTKFNFFFHTFSNC